MGAPLSTYNPKRKVFPLLMFGTWRYRYIYGFSVVRLFLSGIWTPFVLVNSYDLGHCHLCGRELWQHKGRCLVVYENAEEDRRIICLRCGRTLSKFALIGNAEIKEVIRIGVGFWNDVIYNQYMAKHELAPDEQFDVHMRCLGIPYEREYRFFPERRWRADFAIPSEKILIEIEGGIYISGRHVRGGGYEKDCEKYNKAAELGYHVFRFTPRMVYDGTAFATIERVLNARKSGQSQ